MHKVYLLLRNNRQTGPYSLDELLNLNLKPFDLVWVDGRSAAWRYPGEIDTLKAYVAAPPQPGVPFQPIETAAMEQQVTPSFTNEVASSSPPSPYNIPAAPKNVFVSMPRSGQLAPPASQEPYPIPLRPQTAALNPEPKQAVQPGPEIPEATQIKYARPLNEVEENYTAWMVQQKTKKKSSFSKKDLAIAVLIVTVIAGGYWIMSKPSVLETRQPVKAPVTASVPASTPENGITVTSSDKEAATRPDQNIDQNSMVPKPVPVQKDHKKINKEKPVREQPVLITASPVTVQQENNGVSSDPIAATETPVTRQPAAEKGQKKKVKEITRDIFSKKNKKEETAKAPAVIEKKAPAVIENEPRPAENRQAARREETETQQEAEVSLADQVDIISNAPETWMMGVKNLKVTLRNRSNVTIQTAVVNVLYYNENNQLLDKKMVYFNNVAPKGKLTMNAPDHKFADHVDFKLGAVTAKEDRYARQ
jgi:hypothetical protein